MKRTHLVIPVLAVALLAGCSAVPPEAAAAAHLADQLDAVEELVGGEWDSSELGSRECQYNLTLRGVQAGEYRFTSEPVDADEKYDLVLASWTDLGFEPTGSEVGSGDPVRTITATTPEGAALTFSATDGAMTLEGLGACASK